MTQNLILSTDSYKVTQPVQYPPGMSAMLDYMESRGGKHDHVQFFGLQPIVRRLTQRVTMEDVREAEALLAAHFGNNLFPAKGWEKVVKVWGGRLPVRIRAVPEGRMYATHVPLLRVESLDPDLFWLVSWLEGTIQKVWYPTTVATADFYTKIEMYRRLYKTSDTPMAGLPFMLHDFGYRGVSSEESAMIGGGAALVNFMGTDTLPALLWLRENYFADVAGFSVPANEHSTVTSWGRPNEGGAFRNMIRRFGDGNIVSVVSDSYNIYEAVEHLFGEVLRQEILDMKATLVVRPDSGDPVEVVSKVITLLDEKFGSTTNRKGYKVLNKVRIIQGDGINHDGAIGEILDAIIAKGFSAENLVFGMGGGRLQSFTRDTQKFAIKCSLAVVDGETVEVYKDPITDPGKRSLRGGVDTLEGFFGPYGVDGLGFDPHPASIMQTVYEFGHDLTADTFEMVRARAQREFENFVGVPL